MNIILMNNVLLLLKQNLKLNLMKRIYSYVVLGALLLAGNSQAQTQTQTFLFTGGNQTFTVPPCVSQVTIEAHGASGSNGYSSTSAGGIGGNGAIVIGTFTVNSGDVLNIYVGGQGTLTTGGFNGGGVNATAKSAGGGGASDVSFPTNALLDRIIVAGGGGAGGNGGCFGTAVIGGNGGPGGGDGFAGANSTAGGGGFPGVGTNAGSFGVGCAAFQGQAGLNGTNSVGGEGGVGTSLCSTEPTSGGSGGGGFVGGGGGGAGAAGTVGCQFNDTGAGGGGAGGDCYLDPSMTSTSIVVGGAATGDGLVIITYTFDENTISAVAGELVVDQTGDTYQWINCTTLESLVGEVSQTFAPSLNGQYACIVTTGSCTDTTSCFNVQFAGLNPNQMNNSSISVYPNPTNEFITVDLAGVDATIIRVFNNLGQEVYSSKNIQEKMTIDLKNNSAGVYTLQIETSNRTFQQKVVLQ